ncbi:MAG TPA: metallophosphoesterase [Chloroflexi bacterium]|nr:metallophosphoesterase [Chloroflexota bacterium]
MNEKQRFTRRYFLRLMMGSAAAAGISTLGGLGYAGLVEAHWLALQHVDIPWSATHPLQGDDFTIVQLSDLHRGPVMTAEHITRAVNLALGQSPDLAVLTGDYVSESADYAVSCAEALSPLTAHCPVLACLGNHDHWTDAERVTQALTDVRITVLRNTAQNVADGLWVAAVDDVWERHADLDLALESVPADATIVLLAHEPDYADRVAQDGRVHLQLSGHSHGGQVRIPLIGPPALPYLAHKYHSGRHRIGSLWLYVNRGVGMIQPAVRLNCRPEVTRLRLRAPTG